MQTMTPAPKPKVRHRAKRRVKRLGAYKKELWKIVSRYVRLRDCLKTTGTKEMGRCISCGEAKAFGESDAGHFISVGTNSALRYDERNIHLQCKRCNGPLKGNFAGYYNGLTKRYGNGFPNLLLDIHETSRLKQWKVCEIEDLREYYEEMLRGLG